MHTIGLLHKLVKKSCPQIHLKRLESLFSSVQGLLVGFQLTIAGMGRALQSSAQVKHNIKRVDRLIDNQHLHSERHLIYRVLAKRLIGQEKQPLILVDWSDLTQGRKQQLLRASLPLGGR